VPRAVPIPRATHRLSAVRLTKSKLEPGRYADGEGLYLWVTKQGTRQWVFICNRGRKRTELGLGPAKDKPLAVARQDAADARALLARGLDPLAAKKQATPPNLAVISDQYVSANGMDRLLPPRG
jgi:hypothetical protein